MIRGISQQFKFTLPYNSQYNFNRINDVNWSIIQEVEELIKIHNKETGETTMMPNIIEEECDNGDYSIAGDIIDHRDGFVTVKMGMVIEEELLVMMTEVM